MSKKFCKKDQGSRKRAKKKSLKQKSFFKSPRLLQRMYIFVGKKNT